MLSTIVDGRGKTQQVFLFINIPLLSMKTLSPLSLRQALGLLFILNMWVSGIKAQAHPGTDTIAFILKQHKKPADQCEELFKAASYFWNIGQMETCQQVISLSKEIAEKNNYDKGYYDACAMLGALSIWNHDIPTASSIGQTCLAKANKDKYEYGANRANYLLAFIQMQLGNRDSMMAIAEAVLKGPHIIYDSINLPKFNTMLANGYLEVGDYYHANINYLEALIVSERTHNEPVQIIALSNLASINFELKNYEEALKYQQRSNYYAIKNNQVREMATNYHRLANIYKSLGQRDSALYYFRKALPLFEQIDSQSDVADLKTNLGGYLVFLNQQDSGMYYLVSAREVFELLKDSNDIAGNAIGQAEALWRMGHDPKNRTYLNNALKQVMIANEIGERKKNSDMRLRSYYYFSGIYDDLGNESMALYYLKKHTLLNDTMRTKDYSDQIAEMQIKYETDKKEMEISRLNAEKLLGDAKISRQRVLNYSLLAIAGLILVSGSVTYRNVQKKRAAEKQVAILEKQNAIESMRSKIASDVHDEMGANLTRLGLNAQQLLQSPGVPEKEKQLAEKMSVQSKDIITGMREIIWASNPANDNLKGMLSFMRQYIDRFFDGTNIRPVVNFPYDVGDVTLHPEVRRNLFLILKESLNNAVKYSDSDKVDIDFHHENENFNLSIKDYGKGMDEQNKDLFSNGLHNMQMRAEQIRSLFKVITSPGQGVQISIEGKLY